MSAETGDRDNRIADEVSRRATAISRLHRRMDAVEEAAVISAEVSTKVGADVSGLWHSLQDFEEAQRVDRRRFYLGLGANAIMLLALVIVGLGNRANGQLLIDCTTPSTSTKTHYCSDRSAYSQAIAIRAIVDANNDGFSDHEQLIAKAEGRAPTPLPPLPPPPKPPVKKSFNWSPVLMIFSVVAALILARWWYTGGREAVQEFLEHRRRARAEKREKHE